MAWGKLKPREFFALFCLQHSVINCNQNRLITKVVFILVPFRSYLST
nr:MAG TPA: hypothetical protein [Caudoviricetes sp.]